MLENATLGLNGEIRYTIVSGDRTADFSIGEYSGVIRVDKKLDFERKTAYQLTLSGTKRPPSPSISRTSSCTLPTSPTWWRMGRSCPGT